MRYEAHTSSAESADSSMCRTLNRPLDFSLKGIDVEHPMLCGLGITRWTLEHFGVGFYGGKGTMHNKVVIPFHDADGRLIAYAGYSPTYRTVSYARTFDRRLELFNVLGAAIAGLRGDGLVIVTDLLNVLRLYELGAHRVVALPTETLYGPQLQCIQSLVGTGGWVDFVPWTTEYTDNFRALAEHFHVRRHRYYEGSPDELLSQVAHSIGSYRSTQKAHRFGCAFPLTVGLQCLDRDANTAGAACDRKQTVRIQKTNAEEPACV